MAQALRFSGVLLAFHSFQFRVHTRTFVTLLVLLAVTTLALAEPPHRQLVRAATEALRTGDSHTARTHLERAAQLAPDYPRVHLLLARLHASAGQMDAAFAALQVLAGMGLAFAIENDPALAPLRADPRFARVGASFAANSQPLAAADETTWNVTGLDGIIEGLAIHPTTLEAFFSDVRHRRIWYRDTGGPAAVMKEFSAETDGLLGVFALKFSADGRTLWASTSALPEMTGYVEADKGRAFLAAYDVATRSLRRTYALPADGREHVLGDFVLGTDGSVFVSDSTAPIIWRLAPGGTALEKWLEHGEFVSLQGLAFSAESRSLIVADYASGLWRIDPVTREPTLLKAPAGSTLFGIDGLYAAPGGLVAVQNGVNPQRVLRLGLGTTGDVQSVRVLARGHPAMTDAALGQVSNGRFDFIGNSGWTLFADPQATPGARTVTVLSIQL